MPLTLITGRANTGKTGRALEIYRETLDHGFAPTLVVPSRPDAERVVSELASDHALGVAAETFDQLVAERWGEVGDGRAIVTPAQRGALVRRASVAAGAGGAGFARLVGRVVQHMAAGGELWRGFSLPEGDARPVAVAASAYGRELTSRGLIEPAEAAYATSRSMRPGDTIIFHRFSDLTPAQEDFVVTASDAGADVIVTLTWESGFGPTEALDPLIARLGEVAASEHIPPGRGHTADPELRRIEEELFARPTPAPGGGTVSFLMGEGPEAEADIIAGHVRDLIGGGVSPESIAVVFRDPRPRAGTIRRAFAEAGLKVDLDTTLRFDDIPFGKAFVRVTRFLAHGRRADLLSLIRSGYFCDDGRRARELVRGWLQRGVASRDELLEGAGRCCPTQRRLWNELTGAARDTHRLAGLWDELAIEMLAQRHLQPWDEGVLALDSLARSSLARLLDDVASLDGEELQPANLAALLEDQRIGVREVERRGAVQIVSAERIRGRRFETVVVGGLNAGEFPASREDALASDALAPLWDAAGVRPPARREAADERALLYAVLTRARSSLALSRRVAGGAGEDVGPSVFWEQLRDFYRDPAAEDYEEPLPEDRTMRLDETGLRAHVTSSLRAELRAGACSAPGELREDAASRVNAAAARAFRATGSQDTRVVDTRRPERFSPSALETYCRCPHLWFLTREIGDSGIEYESNALLKGSVAHTALQTFYADRLGSRPTDGLAETDLVAHARAVVEQAVDAERVPAGEQPQVVLDVVPAVVRSLRSDAGLLPDYTTARAEWSFGWGDVPEVELGPYGLRGRVDRIDAAGDRAIVIDYKLGSVSGFAANRLREATAIQTLLYAHAVESALGLRVVGSFYRGLADGKTRGIGDGDALAAVGLSENDLVSAAQYRESIEWALDEASRAAEGIHAGRIERTPGDHCDHCPVHGWCEAGER
jgi:hypothetical protein